MFKPKITNSRNIHSPPKKIPFPLIREHQCKSVSNILNLIREIRENSWPKSLNDLPSTKTPVDHPVNPVDPVKNIQLRNLCQSVKSADKKYS